MTELLLNSLIGKHKYLKVIYTWKDILCSDPFPYCNCDSWFFMVLESLGFKNLQNVGYWIFEP